MIELDCPYLESETTAFRTVVFDLAAPGRPSVAQTWYCRHPFHGVRIELGDARLVVEECCAACRLPRERADEAAC